VVVAEVVEETRMERTVVLVVVLLKLILLVLELLDKEMMVVQDVMQCPTTVAVAVVVLVQ
jgi:hypothetical protein|tara:strand:+ start:274 stop:453 length:180 start_codon:yes stop_codon:yes gene_type:complete